MKPLHASWSTEKATLHWNFSKYRLNYSVTILLILIRTLQTVQWLTHVQHPLDHEQYMTP